MTEQLFNGIEQKFLAKKKIYTSGEFAPCFSDVYYNFPYVVYSEDISYGQLNLISMNVAKYDKNSAKYIYQYSFTIRTFSCGGRTFPLIGIGNILVIQTGSPTNPPRGISMNKWCKSSEYMLLAEEPQVFGGDEIYGVEFRQLSENKKYMRYPVTKIVHYENSNKTLILTNGDIYQFSNENEYKKIYYGYGNQTSPFVNTKIEISHLKIEYNVDGRDEKHRLLLNNTIGRYSVEFTICNGWKICDMHKNLYRKYLPCIHNSIEIKNEYKKRYVYLWWIIFNRFGDFANISSDIGEIIMEYVGNPFEL